VTRATVDDVARIRADADRTPSTELVPFGPPGGAWDDVRLQKLWLGVERREWRSLAVFGASASVETIQLTELLAQLAWRYRGQPSSVLDLRDLGMRLVDYHVREMQAQIESGVRLLVSLRSIFDNPTAASIAKQTDAVLLCVVLGSTKFKSAEETIATVGHDRMLGSIVLGRRASMNHPTNGQ
jgi:hypothetical protein